MQLKSNLKTMVPYKAGQSRPHALKLSSNENPLGTSPRARAAVMQAAEDLSRYPEGSSQALREELALLHGISADQILVTNGSDEALSLTAGAYLNAGDRGLAAANTFSEYRYSVLLWGGQFEAPPLVEGRYPLEALAQAANDSAQGKTGIIYLCNPNNPTGTYFSEEELIRFLQTIPDDIPVVLDEAYADYTTAPDYPRGIDLLKDFPQLLVTRTFSKIYGLAALRVGYLCAAPEVIQEISRTKQPFNVNSLAQSAAMAALEDREFADRSRQVTEEGKNFLYKKLDEADIFYYPTQANFLCLRADCSSQALFEEMLNQGLAIRPLDSFGMPGWIRVTLGPLEEMELFLKLFLESRQTLMDTSGPTS